MLLLPALLLAQRPAPVAEIHFEHEPGRIWLKATLNGKPIRAMLDSGAAAVVATEEAAEKAGGRKLSPLQANTMGGPSDAWYAAGMDFGLEGMSNLHVPANMIISTARASDKVKLGFDVAAGNGLFGPYTVEVDYANSVVRFFEPEGYKPLPDAVAMPLKVEGGQPTVRFKFRAPGGKERTITAEIDTGSPVGIEVSRRLAKRDGMDKRYKDVESVAGSGGVGGVVQVRNVPGILADFGGTSINGTAIVDLTDTGANGSDASWDAIVGDDLLGHFDVAFDYAHGKLWLRRNGK